MGTASVSGPAGFEPAGFQPAGFEPAGFEEAGFEEAAPAGGATFGAGPRGSASVGSASVGSVSVGSASVSAPRGSAGVPAPADTDGWVEPEGRPMQDGWPVHENWDGAASEDWPAQEGWVEGNNTGWVEGNDGGWVAGSGYADPNDGTGWVDDQRSRDDWPHQDWHQDNETESDYWEAPRGGQPVEAQWDSGPVGTARVPEPRGRSTGSASVPPPTGAARVPAADSALAAGSVPDARIPAAGSVPAARVPAAGERPSATGWPSPNASATPARASASVRPPSPPSTPRQRGSAVVQSAATGHATENPADGIPALDSVPLEPAVLGPATSTTQQAPRPRQPRQGQPRPEQPSQRQPNQRQPRSRHAAPDTSTDLAAAPRHGRPGYHGEERGYGLSTGPIPPPEEDRWKEDRR